MMGTGQFFVGGGGGGPVRDEIYPKDSLATNFLGSRSRSQIKSEIKGCSTISATGKYCTETSAM